MINLLDIEEETQMIKKYMKPFTWGMGVGAIMLLIVIFSAGWVVTSGSADAKVALIVQDVVISHLAPIAVAQFMLDPNRKERLKEMKELESWKRGEYVQKQGWATMPGSESPNRVIDYEVVKRIMALEM